MSGNDFLRDTDKLCSVMNIKFDNPFTVMDGTSVPNKKACYALQTFTFPNTWSAIHRILFPEIPQQINK
jgi:hypothetical protein